MLIDLSSERSSTVGVERKHTVGTSSIEECTPSSSMMGYLKVWAATPARNLQLRLGSIEGLVGSIEGLVVGTHQGDKPYPRPSKGLTPKCTAPKTPHLVRSLGINARFDH